MVVSGDVNNNIASSLSSELLRVLNAFPAAHAEVASVSRFRYVISNKIGELDALGKSAAEAPSVTGRGSNEYSTETRLCFLSRRITQISSERTGRICCSLPPLSYLELSVRANGNPQVKDMLATGSMHSQSPERSRSSHRPQGCDVYTYCLCRPQRWTQCQPRVRWHRRRTHRHGSAEGNQAFPGPRCGVCRSWGHLGRRLS